MNTSCWHCFGGFFFDDTNIFRIEYDLNTLWSQVKNGMSRNVNEQKNGKQHQVLDHFNGSSGRTTVYHDYAKYGLSINRAPIKINMIHDEIFFNNLKYNNFHTIYPSLKQT